MRDGWNNFMEKYFLADSFSDSLENEFISLSSLLQKTRKLTVYSFETPGKTFKNDLKLGVIDADKDCRQKTEDDKENGQKSPAEVELDKSLGYKDV